MKELLSIIFFFSIALTASSLAKVDPPNYDFSLDKFEIFMPGKSMQEIDAKYPTKEITFNSEQFQTYKYYITHVRYKFAIQVQFHKGIVTDFHARLPQYFLHDIFHQSLINRLGKQDIYKNENEHSIYIWKKAKNRRHYYAGACTITCFTLYYAVKNLDQVLPQEYTSVIQQLKLSKSKIEKRGE